MYISQDQDVIIKRINRYLDLQNLPFRLNTAGMCNGLAVVRAKYRLEGRKEYFDSMLKYIAGELRPSEKDDEVDTFVFDLLKGFFPEQFDNSLSQDNSYENFNIKGIKLKSDFSFGIVTTDVNWVEILKKIQLQEDEEMLMGSVDHRVSISKEGHEYVLYDPNYLFGVKRFKNEETLIRELGNNSFDHPGKQFAMNVTVIRRPGAAIRNQSFPKNDLLYKDYLTEENVNNDLTVHGKTINTLGLALENNHEEDVEALLSLGATDKDNTLLGIALTRNHYRVIGSLMKRMPRELEQGVTIKLILIAIEAGKKEACDTLLTDNRFKEKYQELIAKTPHVLLGSAAAGGNQHLLKMIIDDCCEKKCNIANVLHNAHVKNDLVSKVITSGDYDSLKYLLSLLKKHEIDLTIEEKLAYLNETVAANQPLNVELLLKTWNDISLENMKMSSTLVRKTDLNILLALKDRGLLFSDTSKAIIEHKKLTKPTGLKLLIGIFIESFMNYIRELSALKINTDDNREHSNKFGM